MPSKTRALHLPLADDPVDFVDAVVHGPRAGSQLAVLLTHGAGGDLDTPGLVALAEVIAEAGHTAIRANLPYRQAGRRGAPRADRTVEPYKAVVAAAAEAVKASSWVVGGKSYGGRVATMAAADDLRVDGSGVVGVLCYGYPLHPPGKPDQLRIDHWPEVRTPVAILQGSRDPFGTPDEFAPHIGKFPRRTTMIVVEGGDHSCKVAAKHAPDGKPRHERVAIHEHALAVSQWLAGLA